MSFFSLSPLKRNNLYAIVLVYLLVFFISCLIVSEYEIRNPGSFHARVLALCIAIAWAVFFIYSAEILRTFGYSRQVMLFIRVGILVGILIGFTIGNPLLDYYKYTWASVILMVFHSMTLLLTIVIISAILSDIFRSEETHQDHIWGAIVAYFLGVLVFADLFEMLSLIDDTLFGYDFERGMPNYIECILYSINSSTGLDALYPEASSLFKKISNLENMVGNLFLIVVLGRLLSHPLKK